MPFDLKGATREKPVVLQVDSHLVAALVSA